LSHLGAADKSVAVRVNHFHETANHVANAIDRISNLVCSLLVDGPNPFHFCGDFFLIQPLGARRCGARLDRQIGHVNGRRLKVFAQKMPQFG
jgi:hypothetical protein